MGRDNKFYFHIGYEDYACDILIPFEKNQDESKPDILYYSETIVYDHVGKLNLELTNVNDMDTLFKAVEKYYIEMQYLNQE